MEWSSLKRAKRCLDCERAFLDGEDYYSLLFLVDSVISRKDFCPACWRGVDSGKMELCLSRWQGRYKAEIVKQKEEPIAKSIVERLLRKYLHSDEPEHVNVCYILALLMERKKKLLARDTFVEPGSSKRLIVYEIPKSGETFLVEDPGLDLSRSKEVQRQVKKLLESEE